MTRSKPKSKPAFQALSDSIDNLYYSCSLEFWLSIATVGIAADWIFKFGTESLLITLVWAGILGTYIFSTSRLANRLMRDLRSIKAPKYLGVWLAGLAALTTLFFINAMTDPAHALIITDSGEAAIRALLSGTAPGATGAGGATAGSILTGTAATTPPPALAAFGNTVVTLIKVIFALAFLFGLYGSYQKYNERAELQEVVQGPVVLIIVVLAIDGILGMIFR